MKKLYYSFSKRSKFRPAFQDELDAVTYIISPYVRLEAKPSECIVVEHSFQDHGDEQLFVAYPRTALGNIVFYEYYLSEYGWYGTVHLGGNTYPRRFTLKDNVLYISKSTVTD